MNDLTTHPADRVYTRSSNRETWLLEAVEFYRGQFVDLGAPLPVVVRVSVGFPKGGRRVIGQHFLSHDGATLSHQIFVSPSITEPTRVLDVLLHELVHAAVPFDGHGRQFARVARELGLAGRLTATTAGHELQHELDELQELLGPYPHRGLDPIDQRGQSTRMLKLECPSCGYLVRTTARWMRIGMPTCPCGVQMAPAD